MNLIGKRKLFYGLSLLLILAGIVGLFVNHGLNLGIDFKSGTIIEVDLKQSFTTAEIRDVLQPFNLGSMNVRALGTSGTEAEIRTETLSEEKFAAVMAGMRSKWPNLTAQVPATVDPVFSVELVRQAVLALLIASVGMVAYITWRFEFKFAISAIVALLHDVLMVIGFFAIFRIEVNSEFVAAVLTIIGYSINDTIVVFDRIRENLGMAKKRSDVEQVANHSIVQTMVRSINTSFTTLLAIGAVLLLGGATLKPLATALVVGIVSGTYSSIFIASAIWVDWRKRAEAKRA